MQLDEHKRWSLSRAGIGKRYHNKSLAEDYGEGGRALMEWVQDNTENIMLGGANTTICGENTRTAVAMMARAIHLSGAGAVFVCDLMNLLDIHYGRCAADQNEAYQEARLLCIQNFVQRVSCPLTRSEASRVETLCMQRDDVMLPTVYGMPAGFAQDWYSDEMERHIRASTVLDFGGRL